MLREMLISQLPVRRVRLADNCTSHGSHAIYDAATDEFLGYCDHFPNRTRYDTAGKWIDPSTYCEQYEEVDDGQ